MELNTSVQSRSVSLSSLYKKLRFFLRSAKETEPRCVDPGTQRRGENAAAALTQLIHYDYLVYLIN